MVSLLMFKSFIHFEFIPVYGVSWWSSVGVGVDSTCRASPSAMDENESTKTRDLLGEERWPISQRRRALSLFLSGLLLGLICIGIPGIYVKLNHCQAVRIKQ